jgi:hypothetical protein
VKVGDDIIIVAMELKSTEAVTKQDVKLSTEQTSGAVDDLGKFWVAQMLGCPTEHNLALHGTIQLLLMKDIIGLREQGVLRQIPSGNDTVFRKRF